MAAFLAAFLALAGRAQPAAEVGESGASLGLDTQVALATEGEAPVVLAGVSPQSLAATANALRFAAVALERLAFEEGSPDAAAFFAALVEESSGSDSDEAVIAEALPTSVASRQVPVVGDGTSAIESLLLEIGAVADDTAIRPLLNESVGRLAEEEMPTIDVARVAAGIARELSAASGPARPTEPTIDPATGGIGRAGLGEVIRTARQVLAIAEVAQELQVAQLRGSSQVAIKLDPESLGEVQVSLERTAEGVRAHITTTTAAGRDAVEANLVAIQDALAEAGVAVDQIRVDGPTARTTGRSEAVPMRADLPRETEGASVEGAAVGSGGTAVETTPARAGGVSPVRGDLAAAATTGGSRGASSVEAMAEVDPGDELGKMEVGASSAAPTGSAPARLDGATPSGEPVATDSAAIRLVREVADQVGLLAGQCKSEFQIQLRPDTLGRLLVRMTLEDGGVTVHMRAENPEARAMIESHMGQLRQSFQEQGVRVDRFVIDNGQGHFGHDNQHPRRSRGWLDEVRTPARSRGDDFASELAAAVDFRA